MSTKYTKEKLEKAVLFCSSYADVARYFEISPHGGAQNNLKKKIEKFNISVDHFKGQAWSKGIVLGNKRKTASEILIVLPTGSNREKSYLLRRAMVEKGIIEECCYCNIKKTWNDLPIVLEIDHIDGNYLNNSISNLRFMCPNCHSQTPTYKNKHG